MKAKAAVFLASSILIAWLCAVPSLRAQSTLISSLPTNGTLRTGGGFTLGGVFTVGSTNLIVTALGVYDQAGSGLTTATPVGIWTGSGSSDPLLTSATVPTGSSATLFNSFRYVSISPVTLLANTTYTIGAFYTSSDMDQLFDHGSNATLNSAFTAGRAGFSSTNTATTLTEPSGGTSPAIYIGPNFEFSTVPEPSITSLLAVSFTGIALLSLRRRARRAT